MRIEPEIKRILHLFWIAMSFAFFSCSNQNDSLNDWVEKLQNNAFRDGRFDIEEAKRIVTKAPRESQQYELLNGKKGPIGAALIVHIHLDDRVNHNEKLEIYDWALTNRDLLGFDVSDLSDHSKP